MGKNDLETKLKESILKIADNVIDINMKISHIIHYLRKNNYPLKSEEPYRPNNDY